MSSTPRKKILLIIPNLGGGGAQKVFRQQLHYLSDAFDVTGCVFNWDGAFDDDQEKNVISLDVPGGKTYLGKVRFFILRILRVKKLKRAHGIDISISHLEGADYVNILSGRDCKIICWIHGTKKFDDNIEGFVGWLRKRFLIPFLYKKSDLMVTVSEGIRTELIEDFYLPASKIRSIPNGFSIRVINQKASEGNSNPFSQFDGNILITHCRLCRQKNLTALIEIYRLIKMSSELTKLVILGDGELRKQLIDHCKSLSLRTYSTWDDKNFSRNYDVYFLGYQSNPYQYLARATLYLMTSAWEGFPLSLCEAMACRIPVLAADCFTGPREILAPSLKSKIPITNPLITEFGILMPLADSTGNIELWATTVSRVLNDNLMKEKLSLSGIERVRDFDNEKINREWLKIVNE